MVHLTKPQQRKLLARWRRHDQGVSFLAFRRRVTPVIGLGKRGTSNSVVTVEGAGQWLCLELDGYCHT